MSPTLLSSVTTAKAIAAKKSKNVSKKKSRKGPKDKPKRPLSAYNLFFQRERDIMLRNTVSPFGHSLMEHYKLHSTLNNSPSVRKNWNKSARPPPHGKIAFAEMAKIIGQKWKSLNSEHREYFQSLAAIEKNRYNMEVEEWKRKRGNKEAGSGMPKDEKKPRVSPTQRKHEAMWNLLNQANEISSQQVTLKNEMPSFGGFYMSGIKGKLQASPAQQKHGAMCISLNQANEISCMNEMPALGGVSGSIDEHRPQVTPTQNNHEAMCNILNQAYDISTQHMSELPQAPASRLGFKRNCGFKLGRTISNHTVSAQKVVQTPSMSAQKNCWGPKFNVPATGNCMENPLRVSLKSTLEHTTCEPGTDDKLHDVDFLDFLSKLVSE